MGLCGAVEAIRPDAVKLEADACGAWPCVGRGGITFDLSPPAAFTCSHHYDGGRVSSISRRAGAKKGDALGSYPSTVCGGCVRQRKHSLDKMVSPRWQQRRQQASGDALFCVSRGCWYGCGANENAPICELWGRMRRTAGSLDMLGCAQGGRLLALALLLRREVFLRGHPLTVRPWDEDGGICPRRGRVCSVRMADASAELGAEGERDYVVRSDVEAGVRQERAAGIKNGAGGKSVMLIHRSERRLESTMTTLDW